MNYDITPIINEAIELIVAIALVVLVPSIKKYYNQKFTAEEQAGLEKAVEIAVRAAEQIFKAMPKSGAAKKSYVLKVLEEQGYTINTEEVNALVESKVIELYGEVIE